jgi:hypothetical protein
MRLPSYAVSIVLILLYIVAVGARLGGSGERTPYFKGASAMNYRHAVAVADGVSLTDVDRKANWPEGYQPAGYRAAGVETIVGYAFKVGRYFSEVDGRDFVSRFTVLVFSLCVFTIFALTRRVWDCQAAGFLAAAVVAMFVPLIDATDGSRFEHTPFAVVLATLHVLLLLARARWARFARGAAALVALAMLACWEPAVYYVAAIVLALVMLPDGATAIRRGVVVSHAAAVVAACIVFPHLRSAHALASWPTAAVVAAAIVPFVGARVDARVPRLAAIAAAAVVLTLLATPLRSGADGGIPGLEYAWYRVRFLLEKPMSAQLIPAEVRHLWSFEHAPPSRYAALSFFLPLAFLAAAAALVAREGDRWRRPAFVVAASAAALTAAAYAVDRAALVPAAAALAVLVALSVRGLPAALRTRGPLVVLGGYLVVAQLAFPLGAANPTFQVAKTGGFAHRDPSRFLWVSMENTDRGLVGFVASRTSVKDPFLCSPDIGALLLTFTGRTSVTLPGALGATDAARNVEVLHALYEDESSLYDTCRRLGVAYVLYTIDLLLDTTRQSPSYLVGVPNVSRASAVFRMHFAPEGLRHFTLVYENPHHRLFKVTGEPETLFLTDHPPVYQLDAFEQSGGNVEAFRQRVVELLLTYREANVDRARGNFDGALSKLSWCLQQAPGFTLARIGIGATLTRAGRLEEARDVLLSVIGYAPDNTLALYHTAYVLAALEETDRAGDYLDILFSTATDPDVIEKARLLKTFVDQGLPVTPRAIPE